MPITIDGVEYSDVEVKALEKAGVLQIGRKHDPASTTLTATPLHGPYPGNTSQFGIFSGAGVRPGRFSALMHPEDGLMDLVSIERSEYTNELLEIATGQTAGSGSNATGFCGNPPVAGQLKTCRQNFVWGDFYIKTQLNALPKIGELRNRADVPAQIFNAGPTAHPLIPDIMFNLSDTRDQLAVELYTVGNEANRSITKVGIQGDTTQASNATERGFISEFAGLDSQIKTGYTDSVTGVACAAADSDVLSFNASIGSTIGGGDGRNFVQAISDVIYSRKEAADKVGLEGVVWAITMRRDQFRAATEVYACSYATYRCTNTNAGQPQNQDAMQINALRLAMLNGQYLLVDGVEVPVVFSDGIPRETLANNTYKADMYLVPVSWSGMPLLRLQYFPMDNEYITKFRSLTSPDEVQVLNNGMYLVGKRSTPLCLEYHFAARWRLILETPFLAARIDDIWYTYQAKQNTAYPGESGYVNGGVTYRL